MNGTSLFMISVICWVIALLVDASQALDFGVVAPGESGADARREPGVIRQGLVGALIVASVAIPAVVLLAGA